MVHVPDLPQRKRLRLNVYKRGLLFKIFFFEVQQSPVLAKSSKLMLAEAAPHLITVNNAAFIELLIQRDFAQVKMDAFPWEELRKPLSGKVLE